MRPDELHYAILNELQSDARLTNAEIGRRVGLTAPAVAERIKRMQEEGIIKGFSAEIDFGLLGFGQKVWIGIKLSQTPTDVFVKEAGRVEGVTDMIRTTGEFCFFVAVVVPSVRELADILEKLGRLGETTTFSVLSSPFNRKPVKLKHNRAL